MSASDGAPRGDRSRKYAHKSASKRSCGDDVDVDDDDEDDDDDDDDVDGKVDDRTAADAVARATRSAAVADATLAVRERSDVSSACDEVAVDAMTLTLALA